jgi:hypothetical protein
MGVSIPSNYNVNLGGGLGVTVNPSTFHIAIDTIPAIEIKPVTLDIKPLDLTLHLKDIPSIRMHLPADFKIGMALFGYELMTMRLCGEAQLITEPYHPNPCEICDGKGHEGLILIDQTAVPGNAKT